MIVPVEHIRVVNRISAADEPLVELLMAELGGTLSSHGLRTVAECLEKRKLAVDEPLKLLFRDTRGRPGAVLFCSQSSSPSLVGQAAKNAAEARRALGDDLGRAILRPIATGHIRGGDYVLHHWHRPLSGKRHIRFVQEAMLSPHLYSWVRRVAAQTAHAPAPGCYDAALKFAAEDPRVDPDISRCASQAAAQLATGHWKPCHVLAHNDFWSGNVLLDSGTPWFLAALTGRFVIIDWAGAEISGYPVYDFIRLALSLRTPKDVLAHELRLYCSGLRISPVEARYYLAAALGNLGMNLVRFPEHMFINLARSCWQSLVSAA